MRLFRCCFSFPQLFLFPALATLAHHLAKLLILVFHHLFNSCCGHLFPLLLIALSLSLSFGTFALIALGLIYAAAPASMQRKYFYDPIYEPSPLPCSLVHLYEHGEDQAGRGGVVQSGPRPTLIILNEIHTSPHLCDLLRTHQAGGWLARVAKAIRITHDSCRCCCCRPRWMATFSLSFKLIECYKFYVQNL